MTGRSREITEHILTLIQESIPLTNLEKESPDTMNQILINSIGMIWMPEIYLPGIDHRFILLTFNLIESYCNMVGQQIEPKSQIITLLQIQTFSNLEIKVASLFIRSFQLSCFRS